MKMNTKIALVLGVAAMTVMSAVAAPSADTLHFGIHIPLTDQGVEAGAAGSVIGNEVRQNGTVKSQILNVTVSGLTVNTNYELIATTGSGPVDLGTISTDNNGRGTLHLSGKAGKNNTQLPDGFELAQVTQLDVQNGGGVSVLSTSGTDPTSVVYSVKRTLTGPDGETGLLQINATTKHTKFSLNASGLAQSTDYELFINGALDQTVTSDSKGRVKIKSASTIPTNIMDLNSVELRDSTGSTTILSATLP